MIDISQLPAPTLIEPLDYEYLLTRRKNTLISFYPETERAQVAADLALESDPRTKLLQESAYEELLLRQRINEVALSMLVAYATGSNLDHIAITPPYRAVRLAGESDANFRARIVDSLDAYTTAGSKAAYRYHARAYSSEVKDAYVSRPADGRVRVHILSTTGNGTASAALLAGVNGILSAERNRPLCDTVEVVSATLLPFNVDAVLNLYPGPDANLVIGAAYAAVQAYVADCHQFEHDVTLAGLIAALVKPGVQNVRINSPASDIVATEGQVPYCNGITLTLGERNV